MIKSKTAYIAGFFALVGSILGSLTPLIYKDIMANRSTAFTMYVETSDKDSAGTDDFISFHFWSNGHEDKLEVSAKGTLFEKPSNGGKGKDILSFSSNLDFPFEQIAISMKNITKHAGWNPTRLALVDENTSKVQCYVFNNLWIGGTRKNVGRLPPRSAWLDPMNSIEKCKDLLE